jgi:hypothetical protein
MSTQYRLVVGKDCQRRLLSRPRFVRAVAPRIIIISEERRPLRRPKRKREDNLKINLREIVLYGVDLVNPAQDRDMKAFVNTVSYCHRSIKR